jgi:hypothetical protein
MRPIGKINPYSTSSASLTAATDILPVGRPIEMPKPSQILCDFAFADGQYLSHFSDGDICVMEYRDWQERLFRFVFSGVALVRSFGGAASLCDAIIETESELIDECRRVLADDWGTSGGPKGVDLTEFTITDDVPLFSIVFTDVQIIGPLDDKDRMAFVV